MYNLNIKIVHNLIKGNKGIAKGQVKVQIPLIGIMVKERGNDMSFYDLSAVKMNGQEISMGEFKGKTVLVVNTASKCGLTPQLTGLEELYKKYEKKNLVILGFPCNQFANQDPAGNKEIGEFCMLNYGVTFTMFEKIEVNGENAHPIYQFLKKEAPGTFGNEIKWNFTKFLIDGNGKVVKRFSPTTKPEKMEKDILKYL